MKYRVNEVQLPGDVTVVWGGIPDNIVSLKVCAKPGCFLYLTEEAHPYRRYNQDFLMQFDEIFTCRDETLHPKQTRIHELNTWHMGISLDEACSERVIPKTKLLSIVCSDLTQLPGQKKRYAFANKLFGHFKDRIDFYGTGFKPVKDKWEALADYKYSIAIENSRIPGYFTEKLSECYLAHCLPVYWGAPDILEYFDEQALIVIDIDDFEAAVNRIEKLLTEDPYEKLLPEIIAAKKKFLDQYHIFPVLNRLIVECYSESAQSRTSTRKIRSEKTFVPGYQLKQFKTWVGKKL